MEKTENLLSKTIIIGGYAGGLILLSCLVLTMIEVISRYLMARPLMLADELGGYSLVWVSFLGLAYAMKNQAHVRLRVLVGKLPEKWSNWLRVTTLLLAFLYSGVTTVAGVIFVRDAYTRGVKSASWLQVPLFLPQVVIPIGFILLWLAVTLSLLKAIRSIRAGKPLEVMVDRDIT